MLLLDILSEDYALCMSCGFFRFYAHMGVLHALEENDCLRVKSCSGSSAGALVAAFLASGMKPTDMPSEVFSIRREDIWDVGIGLGLLKGGLFQKLLEDKFPVRTIEECSIPLGVTAYDVLGFRTNCITKGDLATAVRASCTFPGLFQPVIIDDRLHIDGGVWDDGGLMALPSVPASNLVVNIVCGRGRIASSVLPDRFKDARLLTLVLDSIPGVTPYDMGTTGPLAFSTARCATHKMLRNGHLQQLGHNHWCAYIDGSHVDLSAPIAPIPPRVHSLSSHALQRDGEEEGEVDLHGLQRPIPRHHSFQFHEKSRESTEQITNVTDNEITTSSSSSSSTRGSDGSDSTCSTDEIVQPIDLQLDSRMKVMVKSEVTDIDDVLANRLMSLKQNNFDDGDIEPQTSHSHSKISDEVKSESISPVKRKRPMPVHVASLEVTSKKVAKITGPSKKRAVSPDNTRHSLRSEDQSLMKILKRVRKPSSRLAD